MCGIIGIKANKWSANSCRLLYEIFLNQKERGIAGAGISISKGDTFSRFRSISPFRLFNVYNNEVWSIIENGSSVMIHHRFPTSTINKSKFNHPIANEDETIHLIHNGVIYNDKELHRELIKKGHVFETQEGKDFTDSEVLVHVFEDYFIQHDGDIIKTFESLLNKVSGCYAIAINIKGKDDIYLLKHNNPIVISKDDDDNYYFSSNFLKGLTKIKEMGYDEIGRLGSDGYEKLKGSKAWEKSGWGKSKTTSKDKSLNNYYLNDYQKGDKGYWYLDSNTQEYKWNSLEKKGKKKHKKNKKNRRQKK